MIGESVYFMITGMTVVFLFLVIMVLVLEAQGRIINNFATEDSSSNQNNLKKTSKIKDGKKVAIISAAVKHHIKKNTES